MRMILKMITEIIIMPLAKIWIVYKVLSASPCALQLGGPKVVIVDYGELDTNGHITVLYRRYLTDSRTFNKGLFIYFRGQFSSVTMAS